ncbi:uncharacterized protein LOC143633360 [Bidens hawaiensis]|uniref:uncharacterized protein LOC143633360 n=1 Tax=Bidens hawaiensis TaxID=980011 RepID=UPI004049A5A0
MDGWVCGQWDLNIFTVKGIKEQMSVNTYDAPDFVLDWSRLVPKKVSFVAWSAALARLPTFDALEKRNIPVVSNLCPFCGEIEESVEHIFISCGVAQSVWCVLAQWCKVPNLSLFCFLGLTIDQGIACVLMLVALALTYLIH